MPSSLMDLETGDVYIDTDTGLLVTVDDETAVQQIIYMLFKTRPGSEVLNIYYGFDAETAVRVSTYPDSEMIIESLVADALDEEREKLISNVNLISVTKDLENRKIIIEVNVSMINNSTVVLATELEVG